MDKMCAEQTVQHTFFLRKLEGVFLFMIMSDFYRQDYGFVHGD